MNSYLSFYGGHIIHQQTTDDGVIEIVDADGVRSLHFGTFPRQSSMLLSQPHQLELSYTKAMMTCLLFNATPQRVLVVGLGGGSLVKFLLHHFPTCHVTVVEIRQDVIDIAIRYFGVPTNHPNLTIIHDDGYHFVMQQYYQDASPYDLLFVDAYDHQGMDDTVGVQAFFDAAQALLNDFGILSINLWGSERGHFTQTMTRINISFSDKSFILPVEDKGNVIALAMKQFINPSHLKKLRARAEQLDAVLQIDLPKSLQQLIKQNRSFLTRLFL